MRHVVGSLGVIGVIGLLMWWGQWDKVTVGVEAVGWPVRWGVRQIANGIWQMADGVRFVKSGVRRIEDLEREKAGLLVETEELARLRQLAGVAGLSQLNYAAAGRVVGRGGDEILVDQ